MNSTNKNRNSPEFNTINHDRTDEEMLKDNEESNTDACMDNALPIESDEYTKVKF